MKSVNIGKVSVELADYAVGSCAILGIRDSGKTVTAKGIAEQLIDNDVPIIVFDAVGKWRWMKTAAETSRGKAYKVVVAGGREPDLPLTIHSVPEIVRSALKERIPLIIDLFDKHLSKADWRRIVQQAIHIIHYENEGGAVHVFLEEAAEFVPQKVMDGETYAEVEKLVRMGGNASVGITLINQRSQEVNKAVLDNCSTALVLGCQVGKNAIEAVEKWIERLDPKTADELTESLPRLKPGEAWVWTRKSLDKPSREQMPMCRSFHPDRRTPETVLKSLKPANIDEFVVRMAKSIPKVIEEAKAKDPKVWQAKVVELERKLKQAEQSKSAAKTKIKTEAALTNAERKRLTKLISSHERLEESRSRIEALLRDDLQTYAANKSEIIFIKTLLAGKLQPASLPPARFIAPTATLKFPTPIKRTPPSPEMNGEWRPTKCQRAIMGVLATHGPCNQNKVALLARYTVGGSLRTELAGLRTNGCINGANSEPMVITETGLAHGPFEQMPETADERIEWWKSHPSMTLCQRKVIDALRDNPEGLDQHGLADVTGYQVGGSLRTELAGLRTSGVMVGKNSQKMTLNPDILS